MGGRRPLNEQVMVITGATSGIGLVTTRKAAEEGVRLVLVARNEEMLRQLVEEVGSRGSEAIYVVADVADFDAMRRVGEAAIERFGRIDTWVNNAAVSVYGDVIEVDLADHRRVFETNYWGMVHGSLVAVERMRQHGGVLINLGSVTSDRSIPKQGIYSATKQAARGFTDALRMELAEAGIPVSVTLVKPGAIDTPYRQHAKNYLPMEAKNPPPVYAPDTVARVILHCAVRPRRQIYVGGGGAVQAYLGTRFPGVTDWVMRKTMSRLQQTDQPRGPIDENSLYSPMDDGHERGNHPHHVAERSAFTTAARHPVATGAALAAAAAVGVAMIRSRA